MVRFSTINSISKCMGFCTIAVFFELLLHKWIFLLLNYVYDTWLLLCPKQTSDSTLFYQMGKCFCMVLKDKARKPTVRKVHFIIHKILKIIFISNNLIHSYLQGKCIGRVQYNFSLMNDNFYASTSQVLIIWFKWRIVCVLFTLLQMRSLVQKLCNL